MPEAAKYNAADYREGNDRGKCSSGQEMKKSHKESGTQSGNTECTLETEIETEIEK